VLVLVIEDERDLAELIIDYLETEGIECDYAFDGVMAESLLLQNRYDVILLDVTMPKLDGFSLAERLLSGTGAQPPIIFVTARDTLEDKLTGFRLGADDYLTKPFELEELAARIKVLASRVAPQQTRFKLDTLDVDFSARAARRGERELSLSPSQWLLLELLADRSPNLVNKQSIEAKVWPHQEVNKDMLKMLVSRLRASVDASGDRPLIHTIRGAGIALRKLEE